jgi:hypothetical protein
MAIATQRGSWMENRAILLPASNRGSARIVLIAPVQLAAEKDESAY